MLKIIMECGGIITPLAAKEALKKLYYKKIKDLLLFEFVIDKIVITHWEREKTQRGRYIFKSRFLVFYHIRKASGFSFSQNSNMKINPKAVENKISVLNEKIFNDGTVKVNYSVWVPNNFFYFEKRWRDTWDNHDGILRWGPFYKENKVWLREITDFDMVEDVDINFGEIPLTMNRIKGKKNTLIKWTEGKFTRGVLDLR